MIAAIMGVVTTEVTNRETRRHSPAAVYKRVAFASTSEARLMAFTGTEPRVCPQAAGQLCS